MSSLTREEVLAVLGDVRDPCLGAAGLDLSILDLGLIGGVEVDGTHVTMDITFTEPGCMFTHRIIAEIHDAVGALGAERVDVTPRWVPTWTEERMTPRGDRALRSARERYGEILSPSHLRHTATKMDAAAT